MHVDYQVTATPATESFVHGDQYGGPGCRMAGGGSGPRTRGFPAVRAGYSGRVADAETGRVDSWIWSVRLAKTRSAASSACRAGHVRVNGTRVKPAHPVRPGDEIRVRQEDWDRIVEVVRVISKRVSAPVAAECYVDHSPPPPPRERPIQVAIRDRGAGRPTKRDRRTLEKWLRGSPR
jgi:ribosome-associated heat shock protein Hsp15